MGTLIGTHSTANPSPASPTDDIRPRITTCPRDCASARSRHARAIERARLAGALLLARTAAHFVNNDLTSTVILDQMIRTQIERGERVDTRLLDDAIAAAKRAARHLIQLQRITRLEVQPGYGDSPAVLDLRLSHARKVRGSRDSGSISAPRRRHRRHR